MPRQRSRYKHCREILKWMAGNGKLCVAFPRAGVLLIWIWCGFLADKRNAKEDLQKQAHNIAENQTKATQSTKIKIKTSKHFCHCRTSSYLHLGFKTPQDNGSTLIGAWEERQNGQSLVKPKAFIYYLICLPRRLRSWCNIWFSL